MLKLSPHRSHTRPGGARLDAGYVNNHLASYIQPSEHSEHYLWGMRCVLSLHAGNTVLICHISTKTSAATRPQGKVYGSNYSGKKKKCRKFQTGYIYKTRFAQINVRPWIFKLRNYLSSHDFIFLAFLLAPLYSASVMSFLKGLFSNL